jgi:hypothetical protein
VAAEIINLEAVTEGRRKLDNEEYQNVYCLRDERAIKPKRTM